MLWIYRLLFLPALLLLAPAYLWRMRRRGGYAENFFQRFGADPRLPPKPPGVRRVWVQAVSVGEMLAIGPLLEGLRREKLQVYLTTTTSTGYRQAVERYREVAAGIGYFPIDGWPFVARAWRHIAPDLLILAEGERWPEHLRQAVRRGVPVININARLSDRSFARLKTFRALVRPTFAGITRLLPCSTLDEERFRQLGVPAEILRTTGNIKLDVQIPLLGEAERAQLRRELGLPPAGLVLLGSSTWPGEEAALLGAWRAAREGNLPCSLLLVPRHAERRDEIERLLRAGGLRHHLRSRGPALSEVDVAVGDTTGELRKFTQLADLVFIGKSLPPHSEGQTPVEAAALEKPILFGPGMSNFRWVAPDLLARGAARQVADPSALVLGVQELLRDSAQRAALAAAAARWRTENIGAVERTLQVVREELARL